MPELKPPNKQQFCSRLVARSYENVGIKLVKNKDYCTPDDLRRSPLLKELNDISEIVSEGE